MTRRIISLFALVVVCAFVVPAHAHVGSKDVFEQVTAGPYKLFVTIRPPNVIPGVATIEVRASEAGSTGAHVDTLRITPVPLTGEAALHPPTSDAMQRSSADPQFFTGSLWLMASGSWKVRFDVTGAVGPATSAVPVPAIPLSILPMQRPLGILLGLLGLMLAVGMAGIAAAAVREARLEPDAAPAPGNRRRALVASGVAVALVALAAFGGNAWWKAEAAAYATDIYHPLSLNASLDGDTLNLAIGKYDPGPKHEFKARSNNDLLPDHGHLMHLYAIREPEMDAAFHLHPALVSPGHLSTRLPSMPPGTYKLYGDIVHANGFPETLTATLIVPPGLPAVPLDSEDASAAPPPVSAGALGPVYRLPDGYSMQWDRPANLTASTAYVFRFRLLDPAGNPAADVQPYLGMAGHAAFVKDDGSVFAHTHPDGSAAMPAMMLANASPADMSLGMPVMGNMQNMSNTPAAPAKPLPPVVEFPYGFPSPGQYRIFIQMKHGHTVETGVFDASVH